MFAADRSPVARARLLCLVPFLLAAGCAEHGGSKGAPDSGAAAPPDAGVSSPPDGSASDDDAAQPDGAAVADAGVLGGCKDGSSALASCTGGCVSSPLGDVCAEEGPVTAFHGRLEYQLRRPNADLTDWNETVVSEAARGLWILSYRKDALIDAVKTATDDTGAGSFEIKLPAELTADDTLVVMAIGAGPTGKLAYALADPGFAASATEHTNAEAPPDPRLWSWRFGSASLAEGTPLVITEAQGSAAVFAFDGLRKVFEEGQTFYAPETVQSLIGWLGLGTSWTCLTCYSRRPISAFDVEFLHQVRFDGSTDQGYWADSVTLHELGHYLMGAYGLLPSEQSVRYFGEPTQPGLAWKEGWATFFSAMERASTVYYDKQFGGFFWFDIAARQYEFDDLVWARPSAAAGLTQLIDENEVSAMLWQAQLKLTGHAAMLAALSSPRMRVPPFERGYTRRTWADPDHPENYVDTGESTAHLADFFDTLRCADVLSSVELDKITEPALHYPYPSASPLCR